MTQTRNFSGQGKYTQGIVQTLHSHRGFSAILSVNTHQHHPVARSISPHTMETQLNPLTHATTDWGKKPPPCTTLMCHTSAACILWAARECQFLESPIHDGITKHMRARPLQLVKQIDGATTPRVSDNNRIQITVIKLCKRRKPKFRPPMLVVLNHDYGEVAFKRLSIDLDSNRAHGT